MTKSCNPQNLYAALRVTARPAMKAIALIIALSFALVGLAIFVHYGVGTYIAWLVKHVPDFNLGNISAIFTVSSATWQVRAGLVPAQLVVILAWLPAITVMCGLVWNLLSAACDFGASVRDRERREAA